MSVWKTRANLRTWYGPIFTQLIQWLDTTQRCRLFIRSAIDAKHGVTVKLTILAIFYQLTQQLTLAAHADAL